RDPRIVTMDCSPGVPSGRRLGPGRSRRPAPQKPPRPKGGPTDGEGKDAPDAPTPPPEGLPGDWPEGGSARTAIPAPAGRAHGVPPLTAGRRRRTARPDWALPAAIAAAATDNPARLAWDPRQDGPRRRRPRTAPGRGDVLSSGRTGQRRGEPWRSDAVDRADPTDPRASRRASAPS